jgi:hypothetical protein
MSEALPVFPVWVCSRCGTLKAWQFPPSEIPSCTMVESGGFLDSIVGTGVCRGRMMPMRFALEPLLVGRSESEGSPDSAEAKS